MCLAVPGRIIALEGTSATVDFGGVQRAADVSLIDNPSVGDFVLVHVGFAIKKVDEHVAKETYRLLADVFEGTGGGA
ncbi:HypC/HybG/HupF family hydrogenase formation chaperone [Candidatus Woesearchaeota archaeon]|nr:MAG: HypC/HybG/HupF family hydrogenase formation chaperone [Candidatus Woesearchaeota archaeon]